MRINRRMEYLGLFIFSLSIIAMVLIQFDWHYQNGAYSIIELYEASLIGTLVEPIGVLALTFWCFLSGVFSMMFTFFLCSIMKDRK